MTFSDNELVTTTFFGSLRQGKTPQGFDEVVDSTVSGPRSTKSVG
jgi:hypothetical protein